LKGEYIVAKNEKNVVTAPEFRVGEQVFSVLSGGQKLTIKKVLTPKGNDSVISYLVAPQKGMEFRATEGELQLTSPYAVKVRRQFRDYDDDNREDFGDDSAQMDE
jgi:hypothetical protein